VSSHLSDRNLNLPILTSVDAWVYSYLAMTDSQKAFDLVLHAIADPTRRKILQVLKKGSSGEHPGLCATEIEMKIRLSQPTISHHMAVLQKAGLVDAKKEGLWRWYRRNESGLSAFTRKLRRDL
jgi:DNA-binding transcriptional ArsR family regulator